MRGRLLKILLGLAVSVTLLWWASRNVNPHELVGHLAKQRKDPGAMNAFATATILRTMGKPRTAGDSRKVHDYRLDLGPDGQFMVNQLDISALTQLFKRH